MVVLALAFWLGREVTISRQIGLAHAATPGVIVARIGFAHAAVHRVLSRPRRQTSPVLEGAEPSEATKKSDFDGAEPSQDCMDIHGFPWIPWNQ